MKRRSAPSLALKIIGIFIVGYLLGKIQTGFRNKGRIDPISYGIQKLVLPPSNVISSAIAAIDNFAIGTVHSSSLKAEVERMRNQLAAENQYETTLKDLQNQIENLRSLNHFQVDSSHRKIPAEIIGTFRFESRLTLNVGSDNGVAPNMPVISGAGLLAIVQSVTQHTSQAELICSPTIQIGAISLRNPPATGLLHGEDASTLIIDFLDPKAPIQVGDDLITSGFSNSIPRGIPIGRVYRIDDNPDFGTRRAFVYPWAMLGTTRDVEVIG